MTDTKEPINTTSDGTFLSVVCENPEKSVVGQKVGGHSRPPPRNYPPEYELGGDRAVIIVSALVAILSSSTSVSKDNTPLQKQLFFRAPEAVTTAKWRDVLEREQFSSQIVAISGHRVSQNGEFKAKYC